MDKSKRNAIIIGLVLIGIGLYFLIDIISKANATDNFLQYWPVILVFVGLLTMSPKNPGGMAFSFGLVAIGILVMLARVNFFQTPNGKIILAFLFGLFGLAILAFLTRKPSKEEREYTIEQAQYQQAKSYFKKQDKNTSEPHDREIDNSRF